MENSVCESGICVENSEGITSTQILQSVGCLFEKMQMVNERVLTCFSKTYILI